MKKTFKICALIFVLGSFFITISCKSDTQKEIEEYDLRKAKLGYLKDLMDTKEDLKYSRRVEIIDSLIQEEKIRINVNNN